MVGDTAAFIGASSVGPVNEPVLCTNWSQYTKTFGDFQAVNTWPTLSTVSSTTVEADATCSTWAVLVTDAKKDDKKTKDAKQEHPSRMRLSSSELTTVQEHELKAFEDVEDVNIVCAPGQTTLQFRMLFCLTARICATGLQFLIPQRNSKKVACPKSPSHGIPSTVPSVPWVEVYDPYKGIFTASEWIHGRYLHRSDETGFTRRRQTKSFGEPWG